MKNTTNYGFNLPEKGDFYNVEDFNENAEIVDAKLKEFEDGTTPVGNANKLGGKEPSEYVTDADIEALRKWVGSGKEVTDCNTLEVGSMGYCYPNATNAPFTNASAIIFTFGVSESYKTQIAISNGRRIKVRNNIEGSWSVWSNEYVTTADDTNLTGWTELTSGFDLNNALGKYRTASSTVLASLVNRPESVGYGEITVEWFPSTSENLYGTQILKHTYSTTPTMWARTRQGSTWTVWLKIATNVDLAKYLPLDGGGIITKSANAVLQLKNPSAERAYLGFIGSNTLGYLGFEGVDMPSFKTKAGAINTLLHTGNKPTGTYTGNGSATQRSISISGFGGACLIRSSYWTTIVTSGGGFAWNGQTKETKIFNNTEIYYNAGDTLLIITSHEAVNANGASITYYVL